MRPSEDVLRQCLEAAVYHLQAIQIRETLEVSRLQCGYLLYGQLQLSRDPPQVFGSDLRAVGHFRGVQSLIELGDDGVLDLLRAPADALGCCRHHHRRRCAGEALIKAAIIGEARSHLDGLARVGGNQGVGAARRALDVCVPAGHPLVAERGAAKAVSVGNPGGGGRQRMTHLRGAADGRRARRRGVDGFRASQDERLARAGSDPLM